VTPARLGRWLGAQAAPGVLAGLPARQREYLALLVAGFSYRENGVLAGGRSFTKVSCQVGA